MLNRLPILQLLNDIDLLNPLFNETRYSTTISIINIKLVSRSYSHIFSRTVTSPFIYVILVVSLLVNVQCSLLLGLIRPSLLE